MSKLLKKQFGENASDDRLDLLAYSTDASQLTGEATAIVWPKTAEDVYKIIRYCHRIDATISPRGAGTGLAGAAVPQKSIVVDFSKMDRIISIDTKARTAIVEPGVVLNSLNQELAKHKLFFPVIPASHSVCTIGGMIATNAAGMRAVRYGKMIDWIEELEVIDGMGRLFKASKKNIAHFCGTEGTAGVVTKVKLKLTKHSKMRSLDMFKLETMEELIDVVKSLDKDKLNAVEYVDKVAARITGLGTPYYYLFVEYNDDTGQIFNEEEIEMTWKMRESVGIVLASEGYCIDEDPKLPLEKIPIIIDWLEQHDIPSFGHIAIGIIHPRFKTSELLPGMYKLVEELGGDVSGEHGIGLKQKELNRKQVKKQLLIWAYTVCIVKYSD